MGLIPSLNEFVPGTPILASQVNSNFDSIVSVVNGGLSEENIQNLSISTVLIANSAVTTPKILDGAVTAEKLDDSSVVTEKIANTAVTLAKMAPNSVDTDNLVDGAVTVAKSARLTHQVISSDVTLGMSHLDSTILVDGPRTVTLGNSIPTGGIVEIVQWGEDILTITGGEGVTMHNMRQADSVNTTARYTSVTARKIGDNEWLVQGSML